MPYKKFPDIVNNLPLFADVPAEERDKFLQSGRLKNIPQGEYLFRHGEPVEHFYIVCTGAIRLLRETPNGKEITTNVTLKGNTIGKIEILKPFKYHTLSAMAVSDVVLLKFPASWLLAIASHPVISLNILSSISQYAHMVEIEAEQKSTMSVAQRVGCFLQRLCIIHGFDPQEFELPYSKALIASRLGIEPETFSRALTTLKDHGVKTHHSKIMLCDIKEIESYVCEHCSMVGECSTHQKISDKVT